MVTRFSTAVPVRIRRYGGGIDFRCGPASPGLSVSVSGFAVAMLKPSASTLFTGLAGGERLSRCSLQLVCPFPVWALVTTEIRQILKRFWMKGLRRLAASVLKLRGRAQSAPQLVLLFDYVKLTPCRFRDRSSGSFSQAHRLGDRQPSAHNKPACRARTAIPRQEGLHPLHRSRTGHRALRRPPCR
jgi:hypothetical protein